MAKGVRPKDWCDYCGKEFAWFHGYSGREKHFCSKHCGILYENAQGNRRDIEPIEGVNGKVVKNAHVMHDRSDTYVKVEFEDGTELSIRVDYIYEILW